ncbi:MAG TPA: MEDS domain-containing protein, partial [Bacteroidia bacterium]
SALRAYGDMEWALKNLPGTDELIEYEARVNMFSSKYACSLVCAYDINQFSGSAVADILATHPYALMHGKVHKNPHFIEPFELLQKLIQRPKRPLSSRASSNQTAG